MCKTQLSGRRRAIDAGVPAGFGDLMHLGKRSYDRLGGEINTYIILKVVVAVEAARGGGNSAPAC